MQEPDCVTCPSCKKHGLSFVFISLEHPAPPVWPMCDAQWTECGWQLYIDEFNSRIRYLVPGGKFEPTDRTVGISVLEFERKFEHIYDETIRTKKTQNMTHEPRE